MSTPMDTVRDVPLQRIDDNGPDHRRSSGVPVEPIPRPRHGGRDCDSAAGVPVDPMPSELRIRGPPPSAQSVAGAVLVRESPPLRVPHIELCVLADVLTNRGFFSSGNSWLVPFSSQELHTETPCPRRGLRRSHCRSWPKRPCCSKGDARAGSLDAICVDAKAEIVFLTWA